MLAAALSGLLLALAFVGPAILPPAWAGNFSLVVAGVLTFILGSLVKRATGGWGTTLFWLGWVLAAVQWGWALSGSQPSGLPYWLVGLLLGGVGAALVRPDTLPAAAEPESVTTEPVSTPAPDPWTAPLEPPVAAPAPLPPEPAQDAADQTWTVPMSPQTTSQPVGRPVWAAAPDPDPVDYGEAAAPVTSETPFDEEEESDTWSVPMVDTDQEQAPSPQEVSTPAPDSSSWQSQSWWEPADESEDWLEAEALIEREQAEERRRLAAEAQAVSRRRRDHKEEIEDRE